MFRLFNMRIKFIVTIFLLLPKSFLSESDKPHCGGGDPCIYMDRETGWIRYVESKGPKPFPPKSDSWKKKDTTLFLMIASFRDKLCPVTLYNLFTKAAYPERIRVGVVQQNAEDDVDCLEEYCRLQATKNSRSDCPFKANVRINRVDAKLAKGPTWGRALGSQMLEDEEFCMQTDAHMDFVPKWDVRMFEMWALLENEYGILSTYVADSEQLPLNLEGKKGLNELHEVPHLCMVTFGGAYGLVRNWGTKCMRSLPKPKLTNMIWGAGLSFSKCHAERKVPYDPHTPYIFDGEEFSRALRYWTYGYDIYSPHRVWVVHNYKVSQSDPKHSAWAWNNAEAVKNPGTETAETSVFRLKTILGMPGGEADAVKALRLQQSKYGLGDRRSLDQAIKFSGIDTKHLKSLFNGCGNLDFVPFKEHSSGPDYIPRFDPNTELPLDEWDTGSVYYTGLVHITAAAVDMSVVKPAAKVQGVPAAEKGETSEGGRRAADDPTSLIDLSEESAAETDHVTHLEYGFCFLLTFLGALWIIFGERCHYGKETYEEGVKNV